ncbi:MAG: hypothetical protein A2Y02_03095 [Omnitrophica bacterium GWA2_52_12]|nr:MAG: hypothetical protein A2Y02_03095 [Omnitrophica bacterium GWA2_52_12]
MAKDDPEVWLRKLAGIIEHLSASSKSEVRQKVPGTLTNSPVRVPGTFFRNFVTAGLLAAALGGPAAALLRAQESAPADEGFTVIAARPAAEKKAEEAPSVLDAMSPEERAALTTLPGPWAPIPASASPAVAASSAPKFADYLLPNPVTLAPPGSAKAGMPLFDVELPSSVYNVTTRKYGGFPGLLSDLLFYKPGMSWDVSKGELPPRFILKLPSKWPAAIAERTADGDAFPSYLLSIPKIQNASAPDEFIWLLADNVEGVAAREVLPFQVDRRLWQGVGFMRAEAEPRQWVLYPLYLPNAWLILTIGASGLAALFLVDRLRNRLTFSGPSPEETAPGTARGVKAAAFLAASLSKRSEMRSVLTDPHFPGTQEFKILVMIYLETRRRSAEGIDEAFLADWATKRGPFTPDNPNVPMDEILRRSGIATFDKLVRRAIDYGMEASIEGDMDAPFERILARIQPAAKKEEYRTAFAHLKTLMTQVFTEKLQGLMQQVAAGGLDALKPPAPPKHAQLRQKYGGILQEGIRSDADLRLAMEFIKEVSPEFGRKIVEQIEEHRIPVEMSGEPYSHASKSLYSLLQRKTAFASRVGIRKGAMIWEVIHEFTHALPIELLPEPLRSVENIEIKHNDDLEIIEAKLIGIGYLEEAVAIASEIHLFEDMQKAGLNQEAEALFIPSLSLGVQAYEAYGRTERDVAHLAAAIPTLFPQYKEQFEKMAKQDKHLMNEPRGRLQNLPWGSKFREFGVRVVRGENGLQLNVDAQQLSGKLSEALASAPPDQLIAQAFDFVQSILGTSRPRAAGEVTPESLTELQFPSRRKANPPDAHGIFARETEQTENRVRISGSFLQFFEKMDMAEKGNIEDFFDAVVAAARHLDGEQAAVLWQRAYAEARAKIRENPELMKKLGLALLDAGYASQGQYALQAYADAVLKRLWIAADYGESPLGGFLHALIERKQWVLAETVYRQILERIQGKKQLYHEDLIEHYERDGEFAPGGKEQALEFLGSKDPITAAEFHTLMLALAAAGLYTFTYDDSRDLPANGREESYFKGLQALATIADELKRDASLAAADKPSFAQALEKTSELAFDLAMRGSLQGLALIIAEWERSGVRYQGDWIAFVEGLEAKQDPDQGVGNLERVLLEGVQKVAWQLARSGETRRLVTFLKALPDGQIKLDLFDNTAYAMRKGTPEEIAAFVGEWERTLHGVAPRGEKNFFEKRDAAFVGRMQVMAPVKNWIIVKIEAEERRLGLQPAREAALKDFAGRFLSSGASALSGEKIIEAIKNQEPWKDRALFDRLTQAALASEPAARLVLLKRFAWFMPADSDYAQIRAYVEKINEALNAIAAGLGQRAVPLEMRLPAYTESYLFQSSQAAIAGFLIGATEPSLKAEGQRRLAALSADSRPILNPHQFWTPMSDVFGNETGGSIPTLSQFTPAIFHLEQVLKNSAEDPARAVAYADMAEPLLAAVTINPQAEEFHETENKLVLLMKTAALYGQAGRTQEAEALYHRLQLDVHKAKEEHARRQQALHEMTSVEAGLSGGDFRRLQSAVEAFQFWEQDLESRQSAALGRYEFTANPGTAQARIRAAEDAFRTDVDLRRERFDVRSMIAAAATLEEVPALQSHAARIYALAIQKLALMRGTDERVFDRGVDLLVKRLDESALPDHEKDVLLAQAMRDLLPPKGKRNPEDLINLSAGTLLTFAKKVIAKKKYPETEREVLKFFTEVAEDAAFDAGSSWKNRGKLHALMPLFEQILSANPEIAVHENFTLLRGLSSNAKYHESVLALHREPARQQPQGALNADAIRMGMDTAAVMDALLPDFDAALAGEGDEFALHAAGPLLLQLMHRDLAAFAAANKSEMRALTLAQLRAVPSFEALYSRAEPFLFSQAQRSPAQDYLVDILLDYSAKEFAQYKLALYRELLGNARVPLAIQQKAFNGVIAAGVVGEYARNFWSGTVLAGGAVSEERFYGWMKRFFDLNEEQLPSDRLLVYLFQNPDKDEAFFQSYAKMRQSFYLDVLKDGGGTHADDRRFSYNFSWQSNEDFLRVFEGVVQRHRLWVPDLSNEIDVLLVYDRHHVRGTSQPIGEWLSHLRHWYVDGLFDAANVHNANFYHSIEQIEEELKRLIPGFQWTEGQRTHVEGFALRGRVDYRELTRYLNLQLSGAAVEKWRLFLELPDKESARTTPKDFGIPVLDAGQRARLDQMLDRMQKDFNAREDILREKPVEVPAVFQNSPPLVRFALISYFKMLPFGRREAILADFNTEGLTEEQAIKRFFEVTGNEKLGQFLSFRRDLVPERYRAQLESFQENVAPSAFEEVRGTIEKELGGRIEQFFTSINPVPLNVGTIGEVYEVVLKDGTRGVIKVITPSRRKAIETNLARIRSVVYDIQRNQERFDKKIDVESLFREFARSMREEMDFRNEFKNAQDLRAILPPDIGMPEFYEPLVRQSILVQSFVAGRNPRELPEALQRQTANRLSTMFMDHVLFRGLYHDDLHAGNIRVDETGKIWLLDFGRMGRLTTPERDGVIPLLFAIAGGDPTSILGVLEQIGVAAPDFDRAGLQGAIERTLAAGHSTTDLINALFYEAGSHGLQIKSAFLQLLKGILTIEGTAQTLDPEFRLDQQVQAFVMANAATLLGGFFGGGAMNSLVPAIAARAPVSARVRGTPRNVALRPASAIASADKPAGRSEMRSKLSEDVANVQDLVLRKAMPVYMQAQDATFRQLIEANRVTYGDRDTDVLLGILEETGGTAGGFNEFIPEIIRILQGVELKAKSSEWILAKLFSRYEPLDDSETERWGLKILNKLDTAGAALEFTTTRKFESFTARFSEDELFSSTDGQDHKITVTTVGPLVFVIADSLNPVTLQNLKEKLRDEIAEYPNNIIFTEKAVYNTRQIDMGFYTTHVIAAMLKNAEAFRGAVVADFGAGHGILAQVALALGAAHVMLADYEHLTHAEELLSGQGYVRDNTAEPARGSFSLHTLDFTEAKGKRRIREFAKQIDIALVNIGPWEQYLPPGASVGPNYAVMKSLSSAKANWNLLLNSGYHALKTEHVREMNKFYDFFWRRGDAVETLFHSGSSNESNILQVVRAGQLVLGEKPVRPPKRSEMRALDLVADGLTQYAYGKVTDEILAEVSDRLEKAREDISVEQIIEIEREIVTRKLESIQKNKIRRQDKNLLLDIASDNLAADFKNLNGGFAVGVTLSPEDDAKTTALNLIAAIRELRDAGALKRAMVAANPAQRRALSDEAGEADLAPDAIQLLPDLNRVREHQLENGQTVLANATSAASQVSKLLVPVEMLEDHAGLSVADLEMLEAVSVFMQLAAGAVIARESKFGSKPEEIRGKLNQLLQIKGAEIDEKVLNAVFRPKGEGFSLSQKGLLGILQVLETQYDAITAMRAAA